MKLKRSLWQKAFHLAATALIKRKVDFVVAGTIKGGTTALDEYLRLHPQIGMGRIKEIRFFDNERYFHGGHLHYREYHELFSGVWTRKILGEATPDYMYAPNAPSRICDYNPKMKIIMLLREPVSRAYSHWNMERQLNKEPRAFGDAVRQELWRGADALAEQPGFAYVHRGFYSEQLERVWKLFSREQTLILKSEELRKNHLQTLNRIFQFLGVDEQREIPNLESHARDYEKTISPEDKAFLAEVFEPEIKKLQQLLNWDCSKWLGQS